MSSYLDTDAFPDTLRRFVDLWRNDQTPFPYLNIEMIFSRSEGFVSKNTVVSSALSPARTPLAEALDELELMFGDENSDGHIFKPTGYSYQRAKQVLIDSYAIMEGRFIRPALVSDGEGGVNVRWRHNNKMVLCACRGLPSKQNYIYYQSGQEYGIIKGIPFVSLNKYLDWLLER